MKIIPLSKLRDRLGPWVSRVELGQQRVTILRHGRAVAALVPMGDLEALEAVRGKELKYEEFLAARRLRRFQQLKERIAQEPADSGTALDPATQGRQPYLYRGLPHGKK